jgi:hypothetical protein
MRRAIIAGTLVATAALGAPTGASRADSDAVLRAEFERIAARRIFFGHQSVGANLLDGMRQLAAAAGVPIRIAETSTASGVARGTLGHAFIAENGNPTLKLQNFALAVGTRQAGVDIALVKFCYLDFTPNTDASALFARYRAAIERLRAGNPGTTFVHVTAPLTDVQRGPKALLKRLLGRPPYGVLENVRREEYNALLRQAYRGREPIFDLAQVESTGPDGTAVTVEWAGYRAPAMAPQYTEDGGHLNAAGRLRAARELVAVLAAVPAAPPAVAPVR